MRHIRLTEQQFDDISKLLRDKQIALDRAIKSCTDVDGLQGHLSRLRANQRRLKGTLERMKLGRWPTRVARSGK